MFSNYIKVAYRNLSRNIKFSAINILGLAVGISTCLVILMFIWNELSFDRYNDKADRIVRIVFNGDFSGQKIKEANVMPPVAASLKSNFPEVLDATRLTTLGSPIITYGETHFKEDDFCFVDPNFFQIFTIPFIEGNERTALLQPNTMVISRAAAQKYFGTADPIGKVLNVLNWKVSFRITGLFNEIPANSHFHFSFFASMEGLPDAKSPSFMTSGYFTYLLLPRGYDYKRLEAKLPGFLVKYIGPQMEQGMGMNLSEFEKKGNHLRFNLQPLTDIHLHSDFTNDLSPEGDIRYIYIFGAIAAFIMLLACINFMNLATAGASKRSLEVGIRKVLGSGKTELAIQFLLESILMTAIALVLAIILVYLSLPIFNRISGKDLSMPLDSHPWIIPWLLLFTLVCGTVAGSYPAFFLASFKPVRVLKRNSSSGGNSLGLRSLLVIFQFFISVTLIISTLVVYKQMHYIQNIKLGYDKNQVLILPETWLLGTHQEVFYNELTKDPMIARVSISGYIPAGSSNGNNFFVSPDNNDSKLVKALRYDVDYNYIPTLGIEIGKGRNFSRQFGTDSLAAIINQTAAQAFGWGKEAIGHTLTRRDNNGIKTTYHVIGIVKDFHFKSLHELISPLVMVFGNDAGTMILKVKSNNITGLISDLKGKWAAMSPEAPLTYSFLDDRVRATYASEERMGYILGIFSALAIFVACLGLFGLIMFAAEQRIKEIGIRKVLGANISQIAAMLSTDYLKLIFLSIVFASPCAWVLMHSWLQDFAYHTEISWWVFLCAGLAALLIAWITVTFKAVQAALANPINNLRTE
jgi:putative ABC transport system permease protein